MKISMTGGTGCLGRRITNMGAVSLLCNVASRKEIERELQRVKPDVIIHAAAITSIDKCEENYEKAVLVNVRGTNLICEVAEEVIGAGRVVVLSTDQVFNGNKGKYKESDDPNPIHSYGLTKTFAEAIAQLYDCKVLRISRCFDSDSKDISEYLLRLENNIEIEVPDFLSRSYCHFDYMAEAVWEYANRFDEMPEILHLGSSYPVTFLHFMRLVADEYGYDLDLIDGRGERSGFVPRPRKCGLDVSLASKLNLPIYTPLESIQRMKCETRISL